MEYYTDMLNKIQASLGKTASQLKVKGHEDLINLLNICATRLINEDISFELLADSLESIAEEVDRREQLKLQAFESTGREDDKYYIWKAEEAEPYQFLGIGSIPDEILKKFEKVEDGFYYNKPNLNDPEKSEHFFVLPKDVKFDMSRGVPKALAEKKERMVTCPKCKAIMHPKEKCQKCGAFLIEGPKP